MRDNVNVSNQGGKQKVSVGDTRNFTIKIGSTIVIIGILIIFLFAGKNLFNSPSKQIVGTWQTESGFTYVFQSNGQYSHDGGWFGTYSVDGNILTLCPVLNNPEIYKISISSNSLTLYGEDGEIYVKLNKL